MKRNFKPGLRRDIEQLDPQAATSPPALSPPPGVVDEECGTDLEPPEPPAPPPAEPVPPVVPAPASVYPLQRDADTE